MNFTQLFKEEKELYVQNVSHGQVSLQFGRGDDAVSFLLPRKQDPINLTNHVPFKLIAASTDFRKLLTRTTPVVKLLTQEQYDAFYAARAKAEKTTVDAAIAKAESARQHAKDVIAPAVTTAPKDVEKEEEEEEHVNAEDAVNARIIHLCGQVSTQIPAEDRMKYTDLLERLKDIQGELTMDDYEYILANTGNKSIHTWVKANQKDLSSKLAG